MGVPRFLSERSTGVLGRTMAETINNVTQLHLSGVAAIVAEVAHGVRNPSDAGVFLRALADRIDPPKRAVRVDVRPGFSVAPSFVAPDPIEQVIR